jgi:chromosome partitioning protein
VTKMNARIRGHNHLLKELKAHSVLGKLLVGVIPANEAVSYAHQNHQSVFSYDPKAPASQAYAQFVGRLVQRLAKGGA